MLSLRRVATLAALILFAGILSGCTSRSAQAVCQVWNTQAVALHNQYENDAQSGNVITSITDLARAPSALANLFNQMAAVAPTNIEPDFQAIANAFKQAQSTDINDAGDPWAALGAGLLNGLSVFDSAQRVDQWMSANCPGSIEVADSGGSSTTPTNPSATTVAPTPTPGLGPYSGSSPSQPQASRWQRPAPTMPSPCTPSLLRPPIYSSSPLSISTPSSPTGRMRASTAVRVTASRATHQTALRWTAIG